ncbi:hypothetical protein TrCOL_g6573 [Triparma columacea]|uniref:Cytochrome b5 heme-binding domain-containing protein n=1 Tax=Triparma columacea TaxID=722753 RepID=A0A9W7LDA3_9STRA|nr:hypothetical protein TrCOL_g6573 [Triparma columacea]
MILKISATLSILTVLLAAYAKHAMPPAVWDAHVTIMTDYVNSIISPTSSPASSSPPPKENLSSSPSKYDLCPSELAAYTGADPDLPILLSVGGYIFDVSAGAKFYGPSGPYKIFAGCACTRALSIGSMDPEDRNDNLEGVSKEAVEGQVKFYTDKYEKVGTLKKDC